MTKVYFVRHAEPDFNNHDDELRELSPKGMEDRKLVTAFLSDKSIDVALSSPYKRAIDTIKDFTDNAGLAIEVINDFRERRITGEWIADFNSFSMKQWSDFSYKLSDGECLFEVQQRNIAALEEAIKKHNDRNIVIGSHGTALSTIINYFDKTFCYDDFLRIKNKMPWIVEFHFDNDLKPVLIMEHDLFQ